MLAWIGLVVMAPAGGYLAWRLHLLSASGALVATFFGVSLLVLNGAGWFWVAMAFFVPTSLLSRVGRIRKQAAEARVLRGSRRDAVQVLANGGVAWGMLFAGALWPADAWPWAFAGAFAAATADTWATELGGLAHAAPRSILTGKPVPAGTSGGVTLEGTLASMAGSLWIGVAAWGLGVLPTGGILVMLAAGTLGSLADSLLGATGQALYRDAEGRLTERPDAAFKLVRGRRWITNDVVNFSATAVGAALAAGIYTWMA